MTEASKVLT